MPIYKIGNKRVILHGGILFVEAELEDTSLGSGKVDEPKEAPSKKKPLKKYTHKSAIKEVVAKVKKDAIKKKRVHLSDEDKEKILEMCLAGEKTTNEIAEEFGVSVAVVYNIKKQHAKNSEDVELPEEKKEWMCSNCGLKFDGEPEEGEDKPSCPNCQSDGSYINKIK